VKKTKIRREIKIL
jgi:casein kinase II subunit alpha